MGNRRFHVLISLNIQRYDAAKSKTSKAAVIMSICNGLKRDIGVRFLKEKNKGGGGATRPHNYVELNQKDERKKVGHALRDMSVARQRLNNKQRQSLTLMNGKRKSDNKEDDQPIKHVVLFGW